MKSVRPARRQDDRSLRRHGWRGSSHRDDRDRALDRISDRIDEAEYWDMHDAWLTAMDDPTFWPPPTARRQMERQREARAAMTALLAAFVVVADDELPVSPGGDEGDDVDPMVDRLVEDLVSAPAAPPRPWVGAAAA